MGAIILNRLFYGVAGAILCGIMAIVAVALMEQLAPMAVVAYSALIGFTLGFLFGKIAAKWLYELASAIVG